MLTNAERIIILNQYMILKQGDPTKAKVLDWAIEVLANGYEDEYIDVFRSVSDISFRTEPISKDVRDEVIDILMMHADLKSSFDRLPDKSGIDTSKLEFRGFDANNESDHLHYAEYFIRRPEHNAVRGMVASNTHMRTLEGYRRMLERYKSVASNLNITKEEIAEILSA